MSDEKGLDRCNQVACDEPAAWTFTWPGKDRAGICDKHKPKLCAIANAMGLYIQVLPIAEREP